MTAITVAMPPRPGPHYKHPGRPSTEVTPTEFR